ncbi:TAT-variant-translocated molybdopterin oxidoreductase, partial [Capnocytophaga gingivalis]
MSSEKKYWRSVEELDTNNPVIEQIHQNEFVDKLPTLYSGE